MQRFRSRGGRSQSLRSCVIFFLILGLIRQSQYIQTHVFFYQNDTPKHSLELELVVFSPFFLSMLLAAFVALFLLASTSSVLSAPPFTTENFRPAAAEFQAYLKNVNKPPIKTIQACFFDSSSVSDFSVIFLLNFENLGLFFRAQMGI